MIKVGFYQGCCFQGQDAYMFETMKEVFKAIDVDLELLEETTCCGGNTIDEENRKLSYAINARNIALAEAKGLDMLISCNTCYMVIAKAKHALDNNKKLRDEINELLKEEGLEYRGTNKIYHLLDFFRDVVGYDRIRKAVKRPLKGWRVGAYYGCHVLYPKHTAIDDGDNPSTLQEVLKALGAEVVDDYEAKDACCGYHAYFTDKTMTMRKLNRILGSIKKVGVDIVATPCPLCFKAFDIYQLQMEKPPMIPSAFLPELMAYAFGLDKDESGLGHHLVEVKKE
ncbi:CoB--CoM heterodisulfide reductase iron-sulfur subunit B family protein [Phorcysia thermohydrogeniphila]|uniref:Succinate dehydrogenase / fumarate reductase cytochrome b subunit n=1 Tax=Phorcysia thermohydrogeniphila TaxID=936138 RepID=A0A4R1GKU5_9BACT|nr:CoB--CoM heterodisulfide reductase iron-sulfur subunit B family protein [Phorcysia thermohydrogeniphila]TCK06699.1 succinate dehydrogenase / fumarate reductase cytochrome b subunit [Phorcysia thermohydrogeniphila]